MTKEQIQVPDQTPAWTHKDHAIRNWVMIVLGMIGGIAYFTMDRSRESADLLLKEQELIARRVENEVRAATAPLEQQLAKLDADLKRVTAREKQATASLAELEAAKAGTPLLAIKPVIEQSESIQDIREITLETILNNVGTSPVKISEMVIEVFEAVPSTETWDHIARTQTIFGYRQALNSLNGLGYEQDPQRRDEISKVLEEMRKNCPHGKLYAIDSSSADVEWKQLTGLTRREPLNIALSSDTSAFKRFTYLLTEYPEQYHRQWFRFVITVNPASTETRQRFDFVVSGLPLRSEFRTVNMTRAVTPTRTRWAPEIPLLPIPDTIVSDDEPR